MHGNGVAAPEVDVLLPVLVRTPAAAAAAIATPAVVPDVSPAVVDGEVQLVHVHARLLHAQHPALRDLALPVAAPPGVGPGAGWAACCLCQLTLACPCLCTHVMGIAP